MLSAGATAHPSRVVANCPRAAGEEDAEAEVARREAGDDQFGETVAADGVTVGTIGDAEPAAAGSRRA